MKFKHRVKGIVEKSFILRGAFFAIGDNIDFYISETELEFVKSRCKVENLVDLEKESTNAPTPILDEEKTDQIEQKLQEVETNDSMPSKQRQSRGNKRNNPSKL